MDSRNKVLHIWSAEEKEYLAQITPGRHYKEIQKLVNEKFEINLTVSQIKGAIGRYKLNTGFSGRFDKGHVPDNKGIKGVIYEGSKKTWFKKGNTPINHREVGSERITKDGYVEIKITEPNKWRLKHIVIWERENGPLPKGYALVFADSDKANININNLLLVSRQQLLILNRNKLIKNDSELTRTGVIIADIYQKISQRKKAR
ncbi:HNH endonuclease signature motif containing protein [Clostridium sp. HBUAS56017]|uniref:HNH endonuclease signature motif containing protein n=1 Tax=Clostridium sp. HBUAS56017 TaxID=2571128 RepID=UPI00117823C2|nr:HNH endonuclease signature motif containing protein [Clostridium sp. HBUAS56017]